MRFKIVAIRDNAIQSYAQPVFVPHVGAAIRSFGDEVQKKDTPLGTHPEDYELYLLGEYDDQTGEFDGIRPERLVSGKDFLKQG